MLVLGLNEKVGLSIGIQRPAEERLHLHVDVSAYAADLGFVDPALAAQGCHQSFELSVGDTTGVGSLTTA